MKTATTTMLLQQLVSDDPAARLDARSELAERASEAAPALQALLYHEEQFIRWEAAKTLTEVIDPCVIPSLIDALEDEDADVRWTAAEALVAQGPAALLPLLRGILRRSSSSEFCEAAHQVLSTLAKITSDPGLEPLIKALDHEEAAIHAPVAAWSILIDRTPGL